MQLKYFSFLIFISCVFAGGNQCCCKITTPVQQMSRTHNESNQTENAERLLVKKEPNQSKEDYISNLRKDIFFCIVSFLNPKNMIDSMQLSKPIQKKLIQAYENSMATMMADGTISRIPITPINIIFFARGAFRGCRNLYRGFRCDLKNKIQMKEEGIKREEGRLRKKHEDKFFDFGQGYYFGGGYCCILGMIPTLIFVVSAAASGGVIIGIAIMAGVIHGVGVSLLGTGRIIKYFQWKNMDKQNLLQLQRKLKGYKMTDKNWKK